MEFREKKLQKNIQSKKLNQIKITTYTTLQLTTMMPVYITPHRQFATIEPENEVPPPIVRLNLEISEYINSRRWADYDDDEPLPEVIFGKKMKQVSPQNLLDKFNSPDDQNWRRVDNEGDTQSEWVTVKRRAKSRYIKGKAY